MEPNEVVNKLIPYLDMKNEVSFNIQLDPRDLENPDKSLLRIWDKVYSDGEKVDSQYQTAFRWQTLRIPIEKEKYEELLSLLKQNYGSDRGRFIPKK
jgi:hypothetical protein